MIKFTGLSCYLLFCFNAWYFYTKKYRNTLHSNYFVILGLRFRTTGLFERLANCQCILHPTIILSSENHNISKGEWNILYILTLMFDLSFFNVELLQHYFWYIVVLIKLHWFFFLIFSKKSLMILITKNLQTSICYFKALLSVGSFQKR